LLQTLAANFQTEARCYRFICNFNFRGFAGFVARPGKSFTKNRGQVLLQKPNKWFKSKLLLKGFVARPGKSFTTGQLLCQDFFLVDLVFFLNASQLKT